jgi:hypothetical protein
MDTLEQDDVPLTKATNSVNLMLWLTKALVMRDHRQTDTWVDKLVGMLSHCVVGTCVAEGFKLIMSENDEYMNSANYCNIRSVLHISCCLNKFTFLRSTISVHGFYFQNYMDFNRI